jgi:formylglycine-generating enzyme required for sulfatase activity
VNCASYWLNYRTDASTTIVTQYPSGRSAEGVYDLCGNVWEWTSSKHKDNILIYGGSWKDDFEETSSMSSRLVRPDMASTQLGFRVFSKLG